jgi:hypothetical protein
MNLRRLLIFALALAGPAWLRAQDPDTAASAPPPPPTSTSNAYSEVTCTTNDAAACADALQLAADTRDALAQILRLGPRWRFPVHIHVITPDDPLAGKIGHEAAQVLLVDGSMTIDAYLPLDDPTAREFVQRQYVTAILWEKFFANTTKFDQSTPLDIVPLWLIEGLREWANEDPTHNREQIVRRALQNQTVPTLAEVTGWKTLSQDRLLGLWQRAFSFYLVDSLVRPGPRRDDFQEWLDGFASHDGSGHMHFPTEANWKRELADAADRSRNTVYTWQETYDDLISDETIAYAESKGAKVQTFSLDDVATKAPTAQLLQAVKERIDVLTALEIRAHPGWHSTLEAYRTALTALVQDDGEARAPRILAEAHALQAGEVANHQKLVDYLNWFEVTRDLGDGPSHFEGYFVTSKQIESAVADPTHPNPIRTKLLHVESQL